MALLWENHLMKLVLILLLSLQSSFAHESLCESFIPENDLYIPAGLKTSGGITETEFHAVIDSVESEYAPIVASQGEILQIDRLWDNGRVNASAYPKFEKVRRIVMYGGLARHAAITPDSFALVLCHELGHHLGGAPRTYLSHEGQADYFGTLKCLRRAFLNDRNSSKMNMKLIPDAVKVACKLAHPNTDDQLICLRSSMAAKSLADFFGMMSKDVVPRFDTPDLYRVPRTLSGYPSVQCRLDTYFQGALCEASFQENLSDFDAVQGTCHKKLGHKVGVRPACWFFE
jgi:hypothetical protein